MSSFIMPTYKSLKSYFMISVKVKEYWSQEYPKDIPRTLPCPEVIKVTSLIHSKDVSNSYALKTLNVRKSDFPSLPFEGDDYICLSYEEETCEMT